MVPVSPGTSFLLVFFLVNFFFAGPFVVVIVGCLFEFWCWGLNPGLCTY